MTTNFPYNKEKALQASCLLLKLHRSNMRHTTLAKLLYAADRVALDSLEQPIVGGRYRKLQEGVVISSLQAGEVWQDHIKHTSDFPRSYSVQISLLKDAGTDDLCEAEEEILISVHKEFGQLDLFPTSEKWVSHLPEWQSKADYSYVSLIEILNGLGKSEEEIAAIKEIAVREQYLRNLS